MVSTEVHILAKTLIFFPFDFLPLNQFFSALVRTAKNILLKFTSTLGINKQNFYLVLLLPSADEISLLSLCKIPLPCFLKTGTQYHTFLHHYTFKFEIALSCDVYFSDNFFVLSRKALGVLWQPASMPWKISLIFIFLLSCIIWSKRLERKFWLQYLIKKKYDYQSASIFTLSVCPGLEFINFWLFSNAIVLVISKFYRLRRMQFNAKKIELKISNLWFFMTLWTW